MIELMVVLAIMGIVLIMAGAGLLSLQKATSRNDAMINDEQAASSTLALLSRDIRSAHSITFVSPSTDNAADTVVFNENQLSGGTSPVEWTYTPPVAPAVVGTLSRSTLTAAMAVSSTDVMLRDLANDSSNPVFTYYDLGDDPLATGTAADNATIESCTTSVGVNFSISPSPVPGVASYQEANKVAIYDQQQLLSAPGNGQCGSTP